MEAGPKLNLISWDVDFFSFTQALGLRLNLETEGSSEVGTRFFITVKWLLKHRLVWLCWYDLIPIGTINFLQHHVRSI